MSESTAVQNLRDDIQECEKRLRELQAQDADILEHNNSHHVIGSHQFPAAMAHVHVLSEISVIEDKLRKSRLMLGALTHGI